MGRHRKKTRTHTLGKAEGDSEAAGLARANALKAQSTIIADDGTPRALVFRRGKLGRSARDLVDDLRAVMAPHTARKLKEKKSNSLKDYVSVASALGVTHLMAVSQGNMGPNLRIARSPQGPTLSFKVESYSLSSGVRASQRRPVTSRDAYTHSPLVVLNNFEGRPKHVALVATTIQAMFPPLDVQTVRLSECKRVLLVDYSEQDDAFDLRTFYIRAEPQGASRSVRKIVSGNKVPKLGDRLDVSEVLEQGAFGANSDSEAEDPASGVMMPGDLGKGNVKGKRSVVKLRELGPRLRLVLVKVESAVFEGEVLYHKFVSKSAKEEAELRTKAADKAQRQEARRLQQEENVARKRAAEEEKAESKRLKLEARQNKARELAAAPASRRNLEEEPEE